MTNAAARRALFIVAVIAFSGCGGGANITPLPNGRVAADPHTASIGRAPALYVRGEHVEHYFNRVARKIADSEVDANIDSDIVGEERATIRWVMLHEPLWARESVIFVDRAGRIYANKRRLIATTRIARPVPGAVNTFVDQTGHRFAGPVVTAKPGRTALGERHPEFGTPSATTNTGPYRRMYSDPGVWYSGGLHAFIPSGATNATSEGPNGDTGFVYSGGWSSSGDDQVDAGLQYSAARNVSNLFMKLASSGEGVVTDLGADFRADSDVEADFIIGTGGCINTPPNCSFQSPFLTAFAWGAFLSGGFGGRSISMVPANMNDWTASGVVLKDMVSIGQNQNTQPDGVFHDGYVFANIPVDYCGWSGPTFNVCYHSDRTGYHGQVVYPSMIQIFPGTTYDELVGITIPNDTRPLRRPHLVVVVAAVVVGAASVHHACANRSSIRVAIRCSIQCRAVPALILDSEAAEL